MKTVRHFYDSPKFRGSIAPALPAMPSLSLCADKCRNNYWLCLGACVHWFRITGSVDIELLILAVVDGRVLADARLASPEYRWSLTEDRIFPSSLASSLSVKVLFLLADKISHHSVSKSVLEAIIIPLNYWHRLSNSNEQIDGSINAVYFALRRCLHVP